MLATVTMMESPEKTSKFSEIIRVRVTPEMKRRLQLEARSMDMQMSELARLKMSGKLKLEVLVDRKTA